MEDALRHTVKRSLQEMSRVLNGDNKTEVVPVFTVTIVLGKTNRVELKPTVQVTLSAVVCARGRGHRLFAMPYMQNNTRLSTLLQALCVFTLMQNLQMLLLLQQGQYIRCTALTHVM